MTAKKTAAKKTAAKKPAIIKPTAAMSGAQRAKRHYYRTAAKKDFKTTTATRDQFIKTMKAKVGDKFPWCNPDVEPKLLKRFEKAFEVKKKHSVLDMYFMFFGID